VQEVAQRVGANRGAQHHVWAPGWPSWKSWNEVPEVVSAVPPEMPPPSGGGSIFHYNGPSGQAQLPAGEIARRMAADPTGRHLVWKPGFDAWKDAKDVPEIASAGGPPPIPGGGPPPIPG